MKREEQREMLGWWNAVRFKLLAADGRSTAAIATTLVPDLMTSERELRCLGSSLGLTALFVGCATPKKNIDYHATPPCTLQTI